MNVSKFFMTYPVRPVSALLHLVFWSGAFWLLLGSIITFVPGAEQDWFMLAGTLLLAGLFIPRWVYRVAAILLVAVSIEAAVSGYHRGIEYHSYLQQHGYPVSRP